MPAWMMSSEISTDTAGSSFRAWHLFVLIGLVAATVAVITVQPTDTAALVLLVLAVGAGEQRSIVKDGALSIATVMSCTLSVDHRAVDGALGAQFLQSFKAFVEDPISMML